MGIPTSPVSPSEHHQALMAAMKDTLKTHGMELSPLEWLAIASQFVGILTAIQDQRKFTSDEIMEIVGANIEQGNRDYVQFAMLNTKGGVQ